MSECPNAESRGGDSAEKKGQKDPTYPASFIVSNNSQIDSLNSNRIKRIVFVANNSMSGYIAPLNELFNRHLISAPTEDAIREKGWEIIKLGSHNLVIEKIKQDSEALGATGQYVSSDPRIAGLKLILSYGRFPQDVLVISRDLELYTEDIKDWFLDATSKDNCKKDILSKSTVKITGFEQLSSAIINLYNDVEVMYDRVHSH